MGRQISFYMDSDDEKRFIFYLTDKFPALILPDLMDSEDIIGIDYAEIKKGAPFRGLWIWNKSISPLPKIAYIEKQKKYSVDLFDSEVIQYSRSWVDWDKQVAGRLWTATKSSDESGGLVDRPAEFIKFYNSLANWIRRNSIRDDRGYYVFEGANKIISELRKNAELKVSRGRKLPG